MSKPRLVVVDNYDSFTFNLVHYIEEILDEDILVMRNDEIDYDLIETADEIILSPGPGLPSESGDLMKVIDLFHNKKKILGVCLGHQAIAEYFGGKLNNSERVHHGVSSAVELIHQDPLFKDLKSGFEVGRYHSWFVGDENFPQDLIVTSRTHEGTIMSLRHAQLQVFGVQFHPESVLTPQGKNIIRNFLHL